MVPRKPNTAAPSPRYDDAATDMAGAAHRRIAHSLDPERIVMADAKRLPDSRRFKRTMGLEPTTLSLGS
jgi:hypothetical protein